MSDKKISISRTYLYTLLFFSFLLSMNFWFGWEDRAKYLNVIIAILLLVIILCYRIKLNFNFRNIGMFLLISLAYTYVSEIRVGYFASILIFLLVICLNDQDKIGCLKFITKWFGYLLIPSLIIYGLLFLIDLPSFGIQRANLQGWALAEGYGVCKNYLFYMKSEFYLNRFNGPFLEPGHLGMISAFLLFINHFDFKRKGMIPILVSLLLTISLAGYVLLFVGFLMYLYYNKKINIKSLIGYSLLFFAIYLFAIYYQGGDNFLYKKIFSRLEYDEDKMFVGNNRIFGVIDLYFAKLWTNTHTMLFGYPKETMDWLANNGSRGTGYIMWMCRHGIIGTIAVAAMYVFYALRSSARRFSILCLIFVVLMFWQRCYPFWTSWLICFIYGIVAEETRLKDTLNK